jgi:hypothetical protein
MIFCAGQLCICAVGFAGGEKTKKRAIGKSEALIGMKVKNLQRGTAAAVELGGKATMCIS